MSDEGTEKHHIDRSTTRRGGKCDAETLGCGAPLIVDYISIVERVNRRLFGVNTEIEKSPGL